MQKTIVCKYETIVVIEGKKDGSRLEWKAPGIDIYLSGSFTPVQYAVACRLVTYIADEMHIPQISVRRQSETPKRNVQTNTKRMF